ncbi:MAG: hypothetical protein E7293_08580 [Lachnospiraceae bacterium]|nr:hypothetical protein [Lachnospiraceae bacterium]
MNSRERNYDYLRSLSCIAIVLLHVSSSYWSAVDVGSTGFLVMTVYNAATRFAVPVFMMLSGAFMLEPEKEISVKGTIKRFSIYSVNFYIWSAFFAFQGLAIKLITGKGITEEMWAGSVQRFLWGHYHMWFIFLILGFYLLLPVVRALCEKKAVIEYYLIIWIFAMYVVPIVSAILKIEWLNVWISKLSMNMLVGYLGYFILGYYIRKYGFSGKLRMVLYIGGVFSFFYTAAGTILQSRMQKAYVEDFFSPGSWNVLLFSIAVFTFFAKRKEIRWGYSLISKIASCSFIIYMIHPFFLEKLNLVGITTISFNSLFSVPLLTVVIFICSLGIGIIIKKIPYVNKLLL